MPPTPKSTDSKQALLKAREEAIRDEAERRANSKDDPQPRKSGLLPWLMLVTVGFGMYALITKPGWLVTPPPPPEPPAIVDASLRVAMWQQALYIERFRADSGRLPRTMEQAGAPVVQGVSYTVIAEDRYLITGMNGGLDLAFRSEESLDEFLGQSLQIIANRGKQ